jgi:beta-glucosidase
MASTWDVELMKAVGEALAEECIAMDVDVLLGPGVNMKRSPLCGRNFEYFSEDPFLAGEMAAAMINGVQGKGVGTSMKHFAANNQEFQRFSISSEVDERTLREIYLPAFEKAVKQPLDGDVFLQQAQRHICLTEPLFAERYPQR